MDRRDLLKKSAVAGGAVLWATPVIQTLGQGTAHAGSSPDCAGCTNVLDLSPGNRVGTQNINVNASVNATCLAAGCIATTKYVWVVTSLVNCTLDTVTANAANGGNGQGNLDGLFSIPCPALAGASARVELTVTQTCQNPDMRPPTSSSSKRTEDIAWPSCGFGPLPGTVVPSGTTGTSGPPC